MTREWGVESRPRRAGRAVRVLLSTFPALLSLEASPQVAQVGVEPTASFVLSEGGLPIAYRAEGLQP